MAGEKQTLQWQVVGQSVRGASHERSGMPNQDAIRWLPESGAGSPMVLAVADGHGSARYSRSHIGASFAVETAARLIHEFLAGQADVVNLSLIKRAAEDWLPGALVRAWLEAVDEHIKANPFSRAELDALGGGNGRVVAPDSESSQGSIIAPGSEPNVNSGASKLPIAYGATILAAAVAETFVLYLQLGDGEILTVTGSGEVSKPLARDDRLFANETTSLCARDAWRDFRVSFQPIPTTQPALILLSTDGYPNSFRDESGFLQVGSDILEMIYLEGLGEVGERLAGWLTDSTNAGSGDDVTLGILCSAGAIKRDISPAVTEGSIPNCN
jgi:serine/threonine protein phosphatase PrpC